MNATAPRPPRGSGPASTPPSTGCELHVLLSATNESGVVFSERLDPAEVDPLIAELTAAKAEVVRQRAASIRWVDVDGVDWATDGSCMVTRGVPIPANWYYPHSRCPPSAGELRRFTDGNSWLGHSGRFDPAYAPLLRLGETRSHIPVGPHSAAIVLVGGRPVAVVMPLDMSRPGELPTTCDSRGEVGDATATQPEKPV